LLSAHPTSSITASLATGRIPGPDGAIAGTPKDQSNGAITPVRMLGIGKHGNSSVSSGLRHTLPNMTLSAGTVLDASVRLVDDETPSTKGR
jgi:hypothetical protein